MPKLAIVDDNRDSREFLHYLLSQEWDVICCDGGEQALRHFEQDPPDVVIMDIWLRDLHGAEVLRRMKIDERLRRIPVIALTADAMAGGREKYLANGFDEY